ncbi:MAG: hypothetical protein K6F33_03850 [Bacteroidales bacterium]|nr:hypothetical protein [Bacteroidales bacterium]
MDKQKKHIKMLLTLLFAVVTVLAPVVRNQHVVLHNNIETEGHAVNEHCAMCNLEFPAFEQSDPTPTITEIEQTSAYFVPSIIGNLCTKEILSAEIRGPPAA